MAICKAMSQMNSAHLTDLWTRKLKASPFIFLHSLGSHKFVGVSMIKV